MLVLGLDSTGPQCSVSLVDDATVLAHDVRNIGRGHAEVLAGMVADLFTAAGIAPTDVDRLAVCTGPGSFTGLRVALSFAKGFALPRSLPIIGINALEVTARALDPLGQEKLAVSQDVRRGEFFFALFENGDALSPPRAMSQEDMAQQATEAQLETIYDVQVDTRILAWLAIGCDPEDYPAEPLYSRGPDAKLPGGKTPPKPKR